MHLDMRLPSAFVLTPETAGSRARIHWTIYRASAAELSTFTGKTSVPNGSPEDLASSGEPFGTDVFPVNVLNSAAEARYIVQWIRAREPAVSGVKTNADGRRMSKCIEKFGHPFWRACYHAMRLDQ